MLCLDERSRPILVSWPTCQENCTFFTPIELAHLTEQKLIVLVHYLLLQYFNNRAYMLSLQKCPYTEGKDQSRHGRSRGVTDFKVVSVYSISAVRHCKFPCYIVEMVWSLASCNFFFFAMKSRHFFWNSTSASLAASARHQRQVLIHE
jgi:hypothetical protein